VHWSGLMCDPSPLQSTPVHASPRQSTPVHSSPHSPTLTHTDQHSPKLTHTHPHTHTHTHTRTYTHIHMISKKKNSSPRKKKVLFFKKVLRATSVPKTCLFLRMRCRAMHTSSSLGVLTLFLLLVYLFGEYLSRLL